MKWNKELIVLIAVSSIIILLPFFITFLMKRGFLQFLSGAIDSWILFWGSYVGAIIGSVVVYEVAKYQIRKQYDQQVQDVKYESDLMYDHQMNGFLLRNKLDKLDGMSELSSEIYISIQEIKDNIYPLMELCLLKDAEGSDITEEEDMKYDTFFRNITNNFMQVHLQYRKMHTLGIYFPEISEMLDEMKNLIAEMDNDIGIVTNTEKGYKNYIKQSASRTLTYNIPSVESLEKKLSDFVTSHLSVELHKSLGKVKELTETDYVLS